MPAVRVVTDSACDLPDELVTDLGIGLVPLRIRFGEEELTDRTELTTKEFWLRSATSPTLPETSAPSPGAFEQEFRRLGNEATGGVICINLSSRLSATIEAARQAARSLQGQVEVRVVDSHSVTMGEGLVVIEAARRAAAGGSLDEVVDAAERAVASMKVYGVIDTLENLKKGGRIGGAAALVGSLLSIKPVIEVRGGIVEEESKQRTRGRSLEYLATKVKGAGPLSRLAVFGGDAPDLDRFISMLSEVAPAEAMLVGEIGPVIGSHAGPGAIGAAWLPAV